MANLFETERLSVRPIADTDFDEMMAVYGDLDAMRYVGDGTVLSAENCKRWIQVTHENYKTRGYGMACLILRETGETIGFCGLTHPGGQEDPELKYSFHRRFWNQGFATETGLAMAAYGEATLGLTRIISTVDPGHTASRHVLQKCGFTHESTVLEEDGLETALWVRVVDGD